MIAIGSDHRGVELKKIVIDYLNEKGEEVKDFGAYTSERVDYPNIAYGACMSVLQKECDKAILICGTGIGMSMAANKISGIRAALCTNSYMAKMSRMHNDANVLCIGKEVLGKELVLDIIETWTSTAFLGGRYSDRNLMLNDIENKFRK